MDNTPEAGSDETLPFRHSLTPLEVGTDDGKINQIDDTDQYVRVLAISDIKTAIRYRELKDPEDPNHELSPEDYVLSTKQELELLSHSYGVNVPTFSEVWGSPERGAEKTLYTTVDKIEGIPLIDGLADSTDYKLVEAAEALYINIASYLLDKAENGGYFLDDISNRQFKVGKAPGDERTRLYFTDLDPQLSYYDALHPDAEDNKELFARLSLLSAAIIEAESVTGSTLQNARRALLDGIELLPSQAQSSRYITNVFRNFDLDKPD